MEKRCPTCGVVPTGPDTHVCDLPVTRQVGPRRISEGISRTSGPSPGTVLADRYEILEKVGEGGGGLVYRARDRRLDTEIALKVLLPEAVSDTVLRRFEREIRITREIDHPNVSRVFDLGEAGGFTFLTMRWLDGQPLHARVRRGGALARAELRHLATDLIDALAAVHRAGVVHRDVKPANVMVGRTGHAVLVDFGVATEADRSPPSAKPRVDRITLDGQVPGTPAYMAPEQKAGAEATPAADLYSLGLTLAFAASGNVPRDGPEAVTALSRFDRPLRGHLVRCLEREPGERPRDARELQIALASFVRRRRLRQAISLLAVVAVGAATSGYLLRPDRGPSEVCLHALDDRAAGEDSAWLVNGVPDLLAARLEAADRVRIVVDPAACARAVRVSGTVREGGTVVLRLQKADGQVLGRARFEGDPAEAVFHGVDRAAAEFLSALGVTPPRQRARTSLTADAVAYRHFARARELIRRRRTKEALEELRAAVTRDPTFALAQLERFVSIKYFRNAPAAEEAEALRLAEMHASRLLPEDRAFLHAVVDASRGRNGPLLAYLRSHPPLPWRFYTAFRAYRVSDRDRLRFLEEWIDRLPEDPEPHNQLGYLFRALGDFQRAEHELREYVRLAPDLANAHDSLGEFLLVQKRYDEALRELDRALAIDPTFSPSVVNGIHGCIRKGDLVEAEARVRRGRLSVPPASLQYESWLPAYLGIPHLRGDRAEAERRLQEVLSDPAVGSRAYLAREFESLTAAFAGDAERAERAAAEAERLHRLYHGASTPTSTTPHFVRGLLASQRGDASALEEAVTTIQAMEGEGGRRTILEGLLLLLRGDPTTAAERLRSVSGRSSEGFLGALEHARALVAAGRLEEAAGAYDEAIELGAGGVEPSMLVLMPACVREAAALARRRGDEPAVRRLESVARTLPDQPG